MAVVNVILCCQTRRNSMFLDGSFLATVVENNSRFLISLLRKLKLFSAAFQVYRANGLLVPLGSMLEGLFSGPSAGPGPKFGGLRNQESCPRISYNKVSYVGFGCTS